MKQNISLKLCQYGLLVALAVLLGSAPVFLSVAGLALSPLSTLPAALAVIKSKTFGVISLPASSLILLMISPQVCAFVLRLFVKFLKKLNF